MSSIHLKQRPQKFPPILALVDGFLYIHVDEHLRSASITSSRAGRVSVGVRGFLVLNRIAESPAICTALPNIICCICDASVLVLFLYFRSYCKRCLDGWLVNVALTVPRMFRKLPALLFHPITIYFTSFPSYLCCDAICQLSCDLTLITPCSLISDVDIVYTHSQRIYFPLLFFPLMIISSTAIKI